MGFPKLTSFSFLGALVVGGLGQSCQQFSWNRGHVIFQEESDLTRWGLSGKNADRLKTWNYGLVQKVFSTPTQNFDQGAALRIRRIST
jgi:hypothetical protein